MSETAEPHSVRLALLAGGELCGDWHQCMAGYMYHLPYGFTDYGRDLVWPALLLFAVWFCLPGAALRVLWRSWRHPGSSA